MKTRRAARVADVAAWLEWFDAPGVGVSLRDAQGRFLLANAALKQMFGVDPSGRHGIEGLGTGSAAAVRARDVEVLVTGEPTDAVEEVCLAGQLRRFSARRFPVQDDGGRVVAVGCIWQRLPETTSEDPIGDGASWTWQERFRVAFEHAPYTMSISSLDGVILQTNRAGADLLGYTPEEMRGMTYADLVHPDDRVQVDQFRRGFAGGARDTSRVRRRRLIHKDGHGVDYEAVGTLVRDAAGEPLCIISQGRDVTEEVALERKRLELEEQLRRAQRLESVGRLAGGIAHDFNNMLAVILAAVDLARRRTRDADPRLKDCLDQIHNASTRSAALIRQLLILGRRDSVEATRLDLNVVIRDVVRLLSGSLGEDVEVVLELAPDLPEVEIALPHVEQLLLNLAVNARDAMPRGGQLSLRTSRAVVGDGEAVPAGDYVLLSVADDGTGMTPEVLALAFEPYFTTKDVGKGTGLGLSIVFGIVDGARGHVRARSQPGRGTTFDILLPACASSVPMVVAEGPRRHPRGRGEVVLLVEDEPALLALTAQTLRENGYQVVAVPRAENALEVMDGRGVDLLVTDVILPGLSGPALVDRLRAAHPDLPVLLMSGHAEERLAAHAASALGARRLYKPFDVSSLLVTVEELLAAARPDGHA